VERFNATREAIRVLIEESGTDNERRRWYKLDMALVLAEATGRRLGSIRQLAWSDWDFDRNTVRWRSESDKKRREWVVPVPASLMAEVKAYRVRMGGMFGGLMFPDAEDPTRATDRHEFRT
jgi:integrase